MTTDIVAQVFAEVTADFERDLRIAMRQGSANGVSERELREIHHFMTDLQRSHAGTRPPETGHEPWTQKTGYDQNTHAALEKAQGPAPLSQPAPEVIGNALRATNYIGGEDERRVSMAGSTWDVRVTNRDGNGCIRALRFSHQGSGAAWSAFVVNRDGNGRAASMRIQQG